MDDEIITLGEVLARDAMVFPDREPSSFME